MISNIIEGYSVKRLNSREEILTLVEKICFGKYNTEQQRDSMVELFEDSVPDPEAADLIFHHKPELTPEEIVEKALSYKPIITPPPK